MAAAEQFTGLYPIDTDVDEISILASHFGDDLPWEFDLTVLDYLHADWVSARMMELAFGQLSQNLLYHDDIPVLTRPPHKPAWYEDNVSGTPEVTRYNTLVTHSGHARRLLHSYAAVSAQILLTTIEGGTGPEEVDLVLVHRANLAADAVYREACRVKSKNVDTTSYEAQKHVAAKLAWMSTGMVNRHLLARTEAA